MVSFFLLSRTWLKRGDLKRDIDATQRAEALLQPSRETFAELGAHSNDDLDLELMYPEVSEMRFFYATGSEPPSRMRSLQHKILLTRQRKLLVMISHLQMLSWNVGLCSFHPWSSAIPLVLQALSQSKSVVFDYCLIYIRLRILTAHL